MREILFRGKGKDNGRWVRGFPFAVHSGLKIEVIETWDGERHLVDTETVGQWTGLFDNHGVKIYEGDIMRNTYDGELLRVVYEHGAFKLSNDSIGYGTFFPPTQHIEHFIVFSNIHDNPELMK